MRQKVFAMVIGFAVACVVLASTGYAQLPPSEIRFDLEGNQMETAIAVHPTSLSQLMATYKHNDQPGYAFSSDGGNH